MRSLTGAGSVGNWLGAQNPWNLPAPPVWWLQRLAERDADLRVLPGLTEPCYRIARRSPAMAHVTPRRGNDSETGRMCRLGVVPVVSLRPTVVWNDDFFAWLDGHDTWRVGGAEQFVNQLEAQEAQQAAQLERAGEDEADQRSTSAYFGKLVRDGAVAFVQGAPTTNSAG